MKKKRHYPEFRRTRAEWDRLSKKSEAKHSIYIKTPTLLGIFVLLLAIFTLPFFMTLK